MNKAVTIALIVALVASSLIMLETSYAQSIPKPSVPEFTIRIVDNSYDVPLVTTTTIDPYNGEEITQSSGGYHVENKSVEISIKNQPFNSQVSGSEDSIGLYYTVRVKGHFGTEWQEQSVGVIRPADSYFPWPLEYQTTKIHASTSAYTILTYVIGQSGWTLRNGDQIDIEVKAFVGYHKFFWNTDHMFPIYNGNSFVVSSESDWSNIQTLKMIEDQVTTTSPSSSPAVPELPWLALLPLLVVLPLVATVFLRKKRVLSWKKSLS